MMKTVLAVALFMSMSVAVYADTIAPNHLTATFTGGVTSPVGPIGFDAVIGDPITGHFGYDVNMPTSNVTFDFAVGSYSYSGPVNLEIFIDSALVYMAFIAPLPDINAHVALVLFPRRDQLGCPFVGSCIGTPPISLNGMTGNFQIRDIGVPFNIGQFVPVGNPDHFLNGGILPLASTTVPEPSTFLLLGTGMALIIGRQWRLSSR